MRTFTMVMAAVVVASLMGGVSSADWLQFRGPNGNGHIGKLSHPLKWSSENNIAWSQAIPGGGWSSPIVVGDRVFVTAAVDPDNTKPMGFAGGVRNMRGKKATAPLDFRLICLRLQDGSILWETSLANEQPKYAIHPSNTYATESPTSDGQHVFCYFAAVGQVAAVDLDGNVTWSTNIGAFSSGNGFGTGSSLALMDNQLFVQCDNDQSSFVVALDKANGNEIWKRERSSKTSWSTPFLWKHGEKTDLVICGSGTVTGYEPKTGKLRWELTNVSTAFTASPTSDGERVFFGNSGPMSQGPLIALDPGIEGKTKLDTDELPEGVAWAQMRAGPGMASPVVSGEYLYVCTRGILSCYNGKTGERVYKSRLPRCKSITASCWADDKHVFLLDESGKTFVIKAGPEFEIVGTNQIEDLFWSTAAVTDGALLLRGAEKLYCIRQPQP